NQVMHPRIHDCDAAITTLFGVEHTRQQDSGVGGDRAAWLDHHEAARCHESLQGFDDRPGILLKAGSARSTLAVLGHEAAADIERVDGESLASQGPHQSYHAL